jgi:hypothetical protein
VAPPCPWANTRGAAAIAVAAAPAVSKVRRFESIIGALLDFCDCCHGRCGANTAGTFFSYDRRSVVFVARVI